MNKPDPLSLKKAQGALARGDRHEARRWAERTVENDPHNKDAWLIMAEVASSPRARQAYLSQARGIHSKNGSAPRKQDQAKVSPKRESMRLFPILLILLGCLAIGFAGWSVVSASSMALPTPTPENLWALVDMIKPTYTPTAFSPVAETFTATLLAAETSTPVPADTLPLLQTDTTSVPTDTAIPPLPEETATPGAMAMEILPNTPTPQAPVKKAVVAQAPAYQPSGGGKYILVDISEQHLYAYEGDTLVYSFVASTGMHNATRTGTFYVQDKIPNAYGSTWNIWMPNWMGIYYAGGLENGIHALPILPSGARLWAGFLGRPISYGCVVLGVNDSQLLYNWAEVGTPVEIRW